MTPLTKAKASGASPATSARSQPFKALLDEARRSTAAAPRRTLAAHSARSDHQIAPAHPAALLAHPSHARAAASHLSMVRTHHAAAADELVAARAQHHETHERLSSARALALVLQELSTALEEANVPAATRPVAHPSALPFAAESRTASLQSGSSTRTPAPTPGIAAAQAVALIERIETFVRSQRPALALTLNNSLGARVEIEKLGPGRIALHLVGRNGPPDAATVGRLRDELKARGLAVAALSVT